MAKTVTIDNIQVLQVRLAKDTSGVLHVYCEYIQKSGGTAITGTNEEITPLLGTTLQGTAQALVNGIAQQLGVAQGVATVTLS